MGLPQREGRPALSIAPEDSLPDTASWETQYNDPMNDMNAPVPLRKKKEPANGWTKEAYNVDHTEKVG